jgi:rhodanese-related sulfurtransferase
MATLAKRGLDLTICGRRMALLSASARRGVASTVSKMPMNKPMAPMSTARCVAPQRPAVRLVSTSCPQFAQETKQSAAVETPEIPVVSHDDVIRSIQLKRTLLIDVRKFDEVAEYGQIPSAVILPVDDIEFAMKLPGGEFKVKYNFVKPEVNGESIIMYCRSGKRAERAAKLFRDQFGFKNVFNYKGSWAEWETKHPENVKKPLPKS